MCLCLNLCCQSQAPRHTHLKIEAVTCPSLRRVSICLCVSASICLSPCQAKLEKDSHSMSQSLSMAVCYGACAAVSSSHRGGGVWLERVRLIPSLSMAAACLYLSVCLCLDLSSNPPSQAPRHSPLKMEAVTCPCLCHVYILLCVSVSICVVKAKPLDIRT